jgi:hypothetical protein
MEEIMDNAILTCNIESKQAKDGAPMKVTVNQLVSCAIDLQGLVELYFINPVRYRPSLVSKSSQFETLIKSFCGVA